MKIFFLFSFLVVAPLSGREWTSTDGRTIEADFISATAEKVTLKRIPNGNVITVSLDRFSEADRKWVSEQKDKPSEPTALTGPFAHLITGKWQLAEDKDLPYMIYGKGIDAKKKYPLVIGLHGRSDENENGKQRGIINFFAQETRYKKNPAILVAPLCYQPYGGGGGGWDAKPGKETLSLIKKLIKELPIDPKRVYVYGYSMGGNGTASLISNEPKLFAAGIMISGWAGNGAKKAFKKVPVWAFHAVDDARVPATSVQELAKSLKRSKIFKYTEYPKGGHGIFVQVMRTEEIYPWLFSQKKK